MAKKKGVNKYVPAPIIKELEVIKQQDCFNTDNLAFNELARRSRLGAEIEQKMKNSLFEPEPKKKSKKRSSDEFRFPW